MRSVIFEFGRKRFSISRLKFVSCRRIPPSIAEPRGESVQTSSPAFYAGLQSAAATGRRNNALILNCRITPFTKYSVGADKFQTGTRKRKIPSSTVSQFTYRRRKNTRPSTLSARPDAAPGFQPLFVLQRDHRVHLHCAARRQITRQQGHDRENRRQPHISHKVCRGDFEKQAPQQAGQRGGPK